MSTDRRQDDGLDRLVRAALRGETPPEGAVCPDSDAIGAYAAGALSARERSELEPHLATCPQCQAVIAMLAVDAEAEIMAPPVGAPEARSAWFGIPSLRWLVPAGAAALAVVLYVAVKPESAMVGPPAEPAAAVAPEQPMAKGADRSVAAAESAAKPVSLERQARSPGRSDAPAVAVNEAKRADPAQAESALALAETPAAAPPPAQVSGARTAPPAPSPVTMTAQAAAAPPARAEGAPSGSAAGNLAMAAPSEAREKAVASADAMATAPADLEALWRRSDIVVVGRSAEQGSRADRVRAVGASPQSGILVLESLKQPADASLDRRLAVTAAPVGATRLEPGADYVFFLARAKGADGTTQLVTVGSVSLEADRDATLARLRQLAGSVRK